MAGLKHKKRIVGTLVACAILFLTSAAVADQKNDHPMGNQITLQVVSGALFSPSGLGPETPTFNYWPLNVRLGSIFNECDAGCGVFQGNWEAILEITAAYIFNGFGNFYSGVNALIRYNFARNGSKTVPYIQAGCGIIYNDAYKDADQSAIGQALEFTPQAGIGLRYRVVENWTIDAEAIWHHISNANMSDRNGGINALGGLFGVTYYF